MGARFNKLSVDLSKLLVDEAANASANGKEFTAAQRTISLNEAEREIIGKMVSELSLKELLKQLKEMMRPYSTGIITGSPFDSPPGSVKVVRMFVGSSAFDYVEPDAWDKVRLGYNPEETMEFYETLTNFRFILFQQHREYSR